MLTAAVCQDGFVLVGSVAGQRYWSTMLPSEATVTCGAWTPDDLQVYVATAQGGLIVMDLHGNIVSKVESDVVLERGACTNNLAPSHLRTSLTPYSALIGQQHQRGVKLQSARLFEHAPADTGWKDTELKRLLNVKTLVNQEKALVEAFSVISRNLRLFYALKDSMSQVTFAPDTAITDLQWNCEKFNMEERDSDLAAASEPRQQPAPSSASASRLCVLAICFRNGDIKLVTSYDDVSPVVSRARNESPRIPRHNQIEDIMNYEYISSLFGPASRRCRRSGPTLVIIN